MGTDEHNSDDPLQKLADLQLTEPAQPSSGLKSGTAEVTTAALNSPAWMKGRPPCAGSTAHPTRTSTATEVATLRWHGSYVGAIAWSPDGATLASGSVDKCVALWDVASGTVRCAIKVLKGGIHDVAFSQRLDSGPSHLLATCGTQKVVQLWDLASLPPHTPGCSPSEVPPSVCSAALEGHRDFILAVSFSACIPSRLASASNDHDVRVWDVAAGGTCERTLDGHTDAVMAVKTSPTNGALVVSSSGDQTVRVWDLRSGGAAVRVLRGHTNGVMDVSLAADGRTVVSSSQDQTLRVWDLAAANDGAVRVLAGHGDWVWRCLITPDGGTAVALASSHLFFWDVAGGLEMGRVPGDSSGVSVSMALSPCAQLLATGRSDKVVKTWRWEH